MKNANQRCRWHCTFFETAAAVTTVYEMQTAMCTHIHTHTHKESESEQMSCCLFSVGSGVYLHSKNVHTQQSLLNPYLKTVYARVVEQNA